MWEIKNTSERIIYSIYLISTQWKYILNKYIQIKLYDSRWSFLSEGVRMQILLSDINLMGFCYYYFLPN